MAEGSGIAIELVDELENGLLSPASPLLQRKRGRKTRAFGFNSP
jgi:hypothetical protein